MSTSSQDFQSHPFIILAAAFAFGIVVIQIVPISQRVLLSITVAVSLCSVAGLVLLRWLNATILLCVAFVFAGATLAAVEKHSRPADSLSILLDQGIVSAGQPVQLTGVLARQPEAAPEGFYLTLRVEKLGGIRPKRTRSEPFHCFCRFRGARPGLITRDLNYAMVRAFVP